MARIAERVKSPAVTSMLHRCLNKAHSLAKKGITGGTLHPGMREAQGRDQTCVWTSPPPPPPSPLVLPLLCSLFLDLITQLEQFARMTLAKRAIFGISSGTNSDELNAHGFALVDPTSSPSTRTAMQPKDLKGIWDALNWADGLALSLPAFPVTEAPSPTNNNVTTESTHLADVAAAKQYVIAQSNVCVCVCVCACVWCSERERANI